jgi:hypothetical protein
MIGNAMYIQTLQTVTSYRGEEMRKSIESMCDAEYHHVIDRQIGYTEVKYVSYVDTK